ncbi:MAG: hypothetical protein P1U44_13060 [Vicingaceae bacterium]|nr:hypothetical protein [Vicingaceae bacterium]
MNNTDKLQIKSMLQSLTQVSYTALTEVYRLKQELDEAKKIELEAHKNNLEVKIEELFTKD